MRKSPCLPIVRLSLLLVYAAATTGVSADDLFNPVTDPEDRVIALPYAFWNESFGTAAGYVHAVNLYAIHRHPDAYRRLNDQPIALSQDGSFLYMSQQNHRKLAVGLLLSDDREVVTDPIVVSASMGRTLADGAV